MLTPTEDLSRLLAMIVEHIDIPRSYYDKASARHQSLGDWLHRDESKVAAFDPDVRPQGSFRFGLVNRPINEDAEYDLDNITILKSLCKDDMTQKELKELLGYEIKAYAAAHDMVGPVGEHKRCWRLPYADEVGFHLDALPCVPDERALVEQLVDLGVDPFFAECAIAITDRTHRHYTQLSRIWLSSNPRGFARWFERRAALGRTRRSVARGKTAEVENVPPYNWKTTLQQGIQLMKRHRDVMFISNEDLAPISMIITNLAANAYEGETDLATAFVNMTEKMPTFVRRDLPRIPNPANPAEDYADKWNRNHLLADNFWLWHKSLVADLTRLSTILGSAKLPDEVSRLFMVDLTQEERKSFQASTPLYVPAAARATPAIYVPSAPRPWGV